VGGFDGRNWPRLVGAVVVTDGLVVACLSCTKGRLVASCAMNLAGNTCSDEGTSGLTWRLGSSLFLYSLWASAALQHVRSTPSAPCCCCCCSEAEKPCSAAVRSLSDPNCSTKLFSLSVSFLWGQQQQQTHSRRVFRHWPYYQTWRYSLTQCSR
jgi:hypothetical protein